MTDDVDPGTPSTPRFVRRRTGTRRGTSAVRSLARRAPLSLAGVVTLWILALGTRSVPTGPSASLAPFVLFEPEQFGANPLSLVLSLGWAPDLLWYVVATLALMSVGVLAETRIGSRRFGAAVLVSHLAAVAGASLIGVAAGALFPLWVDGFRGGVLGGPAFGAVGAMMAATVTMGPLWRRRIRIVLVLLPLTFVLYAGALESVALLVAALAGLGIGSVLLRYRRRRPSAPSVRESRVLVALICAAAAVGPVLAALSPHASGPFSILGFLFTTVEDLTPEDVREICMPDSLARQCIEAQLQARAGLGGIITACLPSLLLLVLAEGLRRGRRFAWAGTIVVQLGLTLLSINTFLTFLRFGGDEDFVFLLGGARPGQVVAGLVIPSLQPVVIVLLLVFARRLFPLRSGPGTHRAMVVKVLATLVATCGIYVGLGRILGSQFSPVATVPLLLADFPERLLPAAATLRVYPAFLPSDGPATILYEWIGILFWGVVSLLLLRTFHSVQRTEDVADRERAREIALTHGRGSMSWMGLWEGNSYWFDDSSYVPYRVLSGVALTLAGAVGPPEDEQRALHEFSRYCLTQGWSPCFYSVPGGVADVLERDGFHRLQVAEETVLDLGTLAFSGKKFQDVRTAMNQARKNGVHNEWVDPEHIPLVMLDQIRSISEEWVADKSLPEMGFTLGGVDELLDPAVRCSVIVDDERTVHAVASWLPIHEEGAITGYTLDFMRRRGSGFKHSIEVLIAQAALDLQAEGYALLSLSGAPLARSRSTPAATPEETLDRVLGLVGRTLEPVYGFRSLFAFKSKFGPRYVPLYLCYQDSAALPAIGQAITRAYAPEVNVVDVWRLITAAARPHRERRRAASVAPPPRTPAPATRSGSSAMSSSSSSSASSSEDEA